ncbi:MAG TPA: methylmalonyl-CoA mutase [Candidatus Syntrophoarchaeum butanivorans]|nr:MAG: methylmalonyl-CoA mutase [Candidatus Syntrophoarchaeum sp. WYZ-LMO15]HDM36431.1 methylmalonyl-CoA mutase [Candidatus Syntrophoarchaeum butanivorans]HEC57247.1 methylmalonyl-CoA mutase [Candidatus Syntrophoarchaeum butanivorans]
MDKVIRVLISKPGSDGHWRGSVTVSRALADAGMEVIFGGFQSIPEIVETAIQEDVDVIGISIHSMAHMAYAKQLMDLLDEKGMRDEFLVLFGGIIPDEDIPKLLELGVSGVFGPGTMTDEIVEHIRSKIIGRGG